MSREDAFAIWAPDNSPWSPWTKAVLFSFMPDVIQHAEPSRSVVWKVPLLQDSAILVELPAEKGVETGISLALSGYRPIPLYNACPFGMDEAEYGRSAGVSSVIDVMPILRALERETISLKSIALESSAPPAFLLDANRSNAAFSPQLGWFDNRSILRESDLPSAEFLKRNGIKKIIVVRSNRKLQTDLQTVLLSWQNAGLAIAEQMPAATWSPAAFHVPRVSILTAWWNKFLLRFGYRLNGSGSFGRLVHGSGS